MIGHTTALSDCLEPEYSFGGVRLEADGTLLRGETVVHLPPKELAALRLLLAHAGQVVSPLQLKQTLWGDVHVSADSVPKCLSSLRARLEPEVCIQTVYKRGYRFTSEVRRYETAAGSVLPRLAIMPFAPGYSVPEHLGPAIAEETIARLANMRHPAVAVLARDSVLTLALHGYSAQRLGEMLKADLVLTGTLCRMASYFRLRAEMVRVEDGTQIWVEDLLVDQSHIAGLESELVERLAFRLATGAPGDRSSSLGWNSGEILSIAASASFDQEKHARRLEAYDWFLRGRHEWQTLERHRMQDGMQQLQHAIELDPSVVSAKVELVNLYITQSFFGFMSPTFAAKQVRGIAESIPDIAHQANRILPPLGWISFYVDYNLPEALRAYSLTAHLSHDPWTTRSRIVLALSRHRFAEAIELLRAAVYIDPFSTWLQNCMAWAHHLAGQREESVKLALRNLSLFPECEGSALYGAIILAYNGEAARATPLAQNLTRVLPYFDPASAVYAYSLACEGRKDEAGAIIERLQWLSRERFVIRAFNPAVYVVLGDRDSALAELRAAEEVRCPWFFQILADPRLKPLHGLPEFDRMLAILARMESEAKDEALLNIERTED